MHLFRAFHDMTQEDILVFLSDNPERTVGPGELSRALGLDPSVVKRQLRTLYGRGMVLKQKGGRYSVPFSVMVHYMKENRTLAESIDSSHTPPPPPGQGPGEKGPDWSKIENIHRPRGRRRRVSLDYEGFIAREAPELMAKMYVARAVRAALADEKSLLS